MNYATMFGARERQGAIVAPDFLASATGENSKVLPAKSKTNIFTVAHTNPAMVNNLYMSAELSYHRGCVNSVEWNHNGTLLMTGSDDLHVAIWEGSQLKADFRTGHQGNIFSAKFVPFSNDEQFISCGLDGQIRFRDTSSNTQADAKLFSGHDMTFGLEFLPDSGDVFLSTCDDGCVRLFDLRTPTNWTRYSPVNRVTGTYTLKFLLNGLPQFASGCKDASVRLFDLRSNKGDFHAIRVSPIRRSCVSGIDVNVLGEAVVTLTSEDVYLVDLDPARQENNHHRTETTTTTTTTASSPSSSSDANKDVVQYRQKYVGRMNTRTCLKEVAFYGNNQYVVTGGDCGHLFFWDKEGGELVRVIKGDDLILNGIAVQPSPHATEFALAACGIDSTAKIFSIGGRDTRDLVLLERVLARNAERKSTVNSLMHLLMRMRDGEDIDLDDFNEICPNLTREELTEELIDLPSDYSDDDDDDDAGRTSDSDTTSDHGNDENDDEDDDNEDDDDDNNNGDDEVVVEPEEEDEPVA